MSIIMASEPSPELTPETAAAMLDTAKTERDLAELFAAVENKSWWIEDNVYDYEPGTKEYIAACELTDQWFSLADRIKAKIFHILLNEGVQIPDQGQITVLAPFMKRNGYINGDGWWIENNS